MRVYKILPLAYDNTISIYEFVAKLSQYINELGDSTNKSFEDINKEISELERKIKPASGTDVRINDVSITKDGVANIPPATQTKLGVVTANSDYGVYISNGYLFILGANEEEIALKQTNYKAITPSNLEYAVKKALTDSTINYTSQEQGKARELLGVASGGDATNVQINGVSITEGGVANIPLASDSELGVVSIEENYGIGMYEGKLLTSPAQSSDISQRNTEYAELSTDFKVITPGNFDQMLRYGMCDGTANAWNSDERNEALKRVGLMYGTGDSFRLSYASLSGVALTTTRFMFTVPLPKFTNFVSVSLTEFSGYVCATNGRADGRNGSWLDTPYSTTVAVLENNVVNIYINKTSAFSNVVAERPVDFVGAITLNFR